MPFYLPDAKFYRNILAKGEKSGPLKG